MSILQYYYAHAPKNYSVEGAQHFKQDGKIYGGDPVLIKTYSTTELQQRVAEAPQVPVIQTQAITKHAWGDEETKVKVYIDCVQFRGAITKEMIDV